MLIVHPDIAVTSQDDELRIEDRTMRLVFSGDSARACRAILDHDHVDTSIAAIASRSGYSKRTIEECIAVLAQDGFVLQQDFTRKTFSAAEAIAKIREAALFWNRHIMSQFFPLKLFGGEATRPEVLGWGIEFYHFVRAARDYMSRGASRTVGHTATLAELWDHFAEEAFHDEIFLQGLVACGLNETSVSRRPPISSTLALLNYLWECSEEGDLEYAAVFAVMQPIANAPESREIKVQYDALRASYPFATGLFNAFEKHDQIDASLEHATLTLEPLIQYRKNLTSHDLRGLLDRIRQTAENFDLFFEGIPVYYRTETDLTYRQIPNASQIVFADH